jgi:RimJ/RimL family protein N-acetyltransferase
MNPVWMIRTGRLLMRPVAWHDIADLQRLKADPRVFALMLGGVRSPVKAAEELAADIAGWPAHGYGMWAVFDAADGSFAGITGLEERPDGRGIALRFAFWPEMRGRGLAREAAGAALRFGHEQAGLARIVAVAREDNFASRTVLGSIGMVECERFLRDGGQVLVFESVQHRRPPAAPGRR